MNVFDALKDYGAKSKDYPAQVKCLHILAEAHKRAGEIQQVRRQREHERKIAILGTRNMMLATLDLHELERDACAILCPAIDSVNQVEKRKAWQWVKAQPWGEEFKTGGIQKERF